MVKDFSFHNKNKLTFLYLYLLHIMAVDYGFIKPMIELLKILTNFTAPPPPHPKPSNCALPFLKSNGRPI